MTHVCLLLSGAALLINGLAALHVVPARDAAVLSLVIGSTQLILGVTYLAATGVTAGSAGTAGAAAAGPQVLLSASGMFLFGLTYLYVGLDFLLGLGSKGLGWFCGMVAFVGLLLALAWFAEDPLLAVLWLGWSLLWGLFFASMALGLSRVDRFTGWALVLTSQVSATVPAFLGLAGVWPRSPVVAAAAAALLAGLFAAAGVLARRTLPSDGTA